MVQEKKQKQGKSYKNLELAKIFQLLNNEECIISD